MIDIFENPPCPGTTASAVVTGVFGPHEPSSEAQPESFLLSAATATTAERNSEPENGSPGLLNTADVSLDQSQVMTDFTSLGGYYGGLVEPEYPKSMNMNGMVMQWTELTSRIFYGDQSELAVDGRLTDSQMRDLYNYSIGVGHDGFDVSQISVHSSLRTILHSFVFLSLLLT